MLHTIAKNSQLRDILNLLKTAFDSSTLVKVILSKQTKINQLNDNVKNIVAKKVIIKGEQSWNLVYRHQTKDITKNFSYQLGLEEIEVNLLSNFAILDVFTTQQHFHILNLKGNFKVITKLNKVELQANNEHNKVKDRLIVKASNQYLVELGLLSADGQIKSQMQHKFKQINKYIESVAPYFKTLDRDEVLIYDMGAGKGYLTFALYDYCNNTLGKNFKLVGVEQRQELVTQSNTIASKCGFTNLSFEQGRISDYYQTKLDVIVALHACDIATDEAIFAGIKNQAELIILAPCCQKQVRKDIETNKASNLFKAITKHGILFEKQAEILTDTIRSLILESCGYRTSVVEFIEWGETPKNTLIIAKKSKITDKNKQSALEQIQLIKQQFSISSHHLETLIKG
jgi:2-polyprenyl-3-methyl-5-hydroxy-6-metoxy-1,4-benzoquinol methylase